MALEAGLIVEADIDDNQTGDRDTYKIHKDKGRSQDNQFINYLAFHIACLSTTDGLQDKRPELLDLIKDYRRSKDISFVRNLVNYCYGR